MQSQLASKDVFTPTGKPIHSYVSRTQIDEYGTQIDLDAEIKKALLENGLIINVYGPSKSGKTAAIENGASQLNMSIVTLSGSNLKSDRDFWETVAIEVQIPVEESNTNSNTQRRNNKSTSKGGISAYSEEHSNESGSEKNNSSQQKTIVNTSKKVIDHFINNSLILFLDDFHYANEDIRRGIAQKIKAAAANGMKVCIASVPQKKDAFSIANQDANGRIREFKFEYWGIEDLIKIGAAFSKLNVSIDTNSLELLAIEAGGSPQLMQRFCLNLSDYYKVDEPRNTVLNIKLTTPILDKVFIEAKKRYYLLVY